MKHYYEILSIPIHIQEGLQKFEKGFMDAPDIIQAYGMVIDRQRELVMQSKIPKYTPTRIAMG
jgi:hypothetical protein